MLILRICLHLLSSPDQRSYTPIHPGKLSCYRFSSDFFLAKMVYTYIIRIRHYTNYHRNWLKTIIHLSHMFYF